MMRALLFVAMILAASSARAAGEIATSVERASFVGDLTSERAVPLYGVHLRYWLPDVVEQPWKGGLSWDIMHADVRHEGDQFPYDPGASLHLLVFLITPTVCHEVGFAALDACGGIGIGTVNVNSSANRQDYGSWSYQLDLKREHEVRIGLMAKFIGKVEQTQAHRPSEFSVEAVGVSLAYDFNFQQRH